MSTYEITINEHLRRTVCVEADSLENAVAIVEQMIDDGEIILDSDDFYERKYSVSDYGYGFGVVTLGTKYDWIRTIMSLNTDEDLTLQINNKLFLWIERYQDGRSDTGSDTLRIELVKGFVDEDGVNVFEETLETYEIDINNIRTIVDTLLDIFDAYVGKKLSATEIVAGVLGTVVATGILASMSVFAACF